MPGDPPDTFLHALAFAVLAGLSRLSFPRESFWRLLVALAALGLAIELVQAIPILGRQASSRDLIIDIAASAAALLVLWPFSRMRLKDATRYAEAH